MGSFGMSMGGTTVDRAIWALQPMIAEPCGGRYCPMILIPSPPSAISKGPTDRRIQLGEFKRALNGG